MGNGLILFFRTHARWIVVVVGDRLAARDDNRTVARLTKGMTAYLYKGAVVGIRQLGRQPLSLIISYPNNQH